MLRNTCGAWYVRLVTNYERKKLKLAFQIPRATLVKELNNAASLNKIAIDFHTP